MANGAQQSSVMTLPAPTGGWNDRDPLGAKPASDANIIVNWFPTTASVRSRSGYTQHSDASAPGESVETSTVHTTEDGTSRLIGACDEKLWDFTSGVANDISGGSAVTVNRWNDLSMNHTLLLLNGTDQPRQYKYVDSTTNVSDVAYTGTDPDSGALDDAFLIQATSYRDRLYLTQKDEAWFWYGGSKAIAGALTAFDLGFIFRRGGSIQFVATWSTDDGGGADDRFIIASTEGELLIYTGSYPGGADWNKVGQFFLPKFLGRKAFLNLDNDLLLLTERGVLSLRQIVAGKEVTSSDVQLSNKIQNSFRAAASSYGSNFGWSMVSYPDGPYLLVNVPVIENAQSEQYVMNLLTGAWTKFTGQSANCWTIYSGDIYFGGNDGKMLQADDGNKDDQSPISVDLQTAFNYLGVPSSVKSVNMVRPFFEVSGNAIFDYGVDVDFRTGPVVDQFSLAVTNGSDWGADFWGVATWAKPELVADWQGATALGNSIALRLKSNLDGVTCDLNAILVNYVIGGVL